MRDGERFAYVSDNKKQIIVDYYKSSKSEVIFDVDKVEKSPVKQVEWFQFDDSEGRILLLTVTELLFFFYIPRRQRFSLSLTANLMQVIYNIPFFFRKSIATSSTVFSFIST